MVDGIYACNRIEVRVRKRQCLASVHNAKFSTVLKAALSGQRICIRDGLFVKINPNKGAPCFCNNSQSRSARTAGYIQELLPGGKFKPPEKHVLLRSGEPTELSYILAGAFAADLRIQLCLKVAVVRVVVGATLLAFGFRLCVHGILRLISPMLFVVVARWRDHLPTGRDPAVSRRGSPGPIAMNAAALRLQKSAKGPLRSTPKASATRPAMRTTAIVPNGIPARRIKDMK